ncbi:NADH:flavin oxidoreductase/NADH oxidase [Actinomyces sp. zg-332]|uniref:NADH:flavin oxidoreductase/NADH oxidase n=1 Tax=Actinomyces sp. zg-332 TaxID=2708340 RepID=UPI00141F0A58|nr:NADH:flavin oxidoreductase/NADH oxidase [Actinomyces sp. zg-332]QPK93600.1 NADH:flavin oxidoreductase/NADH oxidase [Actinomyces sp. zg-332]
MSKLLSSANIGGLELKNRVVMSPMCMYEVKKQDGIPTTFHFTHYGARAISGVGLIIQEATAIHPDGRLTNYDLGLWNDEQAMALKDLVDSIHYLGAKIGVQIVHSGRKALNVENPLSPSKIAYGEPYNAPTVMTTQQVKATIKDFIDSARRAEQAGYDMIELHAAHGYLINQFISPLSNQRKDEYGGSLENRYRFLQEIIDGCKKVFTKPIWVRISATDYDETGQQNTLQDWQQMAKWMEEQHVECIDVSTGGLLNKKPNIPVHAAFQTPYATKIKEAVNIDVATVGLINDPGLAEHILQTNQADIILLGRVLLRNVNWVNEAAKILYDEQHQVFNNSYLRGQ